MNGKKVLIGVGIVVVLGGLVYANLAFKKTTGVDVSVEKIQLRDLEALVSASGTIQPKTSVDISAETVGKIVDLKVNEGDTVKKGQFLLQIDPRDLEEAVHNQEASLAATVSSLAEMRQNVQSAKVALVQSQANLKREEDLWKKGLATKQDYENAQTDLQTKQAMADQADQTIKTQDLRIKQQQAILDSANYDLTKVRIVSPLDGLITRSNVLAGETVMMGTMNNAGTVLLTVADMSIIEAQVQVDETDIPFVRLGQPAKVTVDALPDRTFTGKVTEVGNSPIQATGAAATTRATDFLVKVTLDQAIKDVRPGFSTTAVITTATRAKAVAVPIQATTVREMLLDAAGNVVRDPAPTPGQTVRRPTPADQTLKPGQTRKEIEGVFVVKDGKAIFTAIKTGIAGEKFFEVTSGLSDGDQVITGPFTSVRTMKDGDPVKVSTTAAAPTVVK